MKKIITYFSLFFFLLSLFISFIKKEENKLERVSKYIEVNVNSGKIEIRKDDHGGFHGDGEEFIKISFPNKNILKEIKANSHWKKLPFDRNVKILVYGIEGKNFKYGPYVDENTIPKIKNGYYYFYDKQSDEKNAYNSNKVLNRHSLNFIICVYDEDKNIMYFVESDS